MSVFDLKRGDSAYVTAVGIYGAAGDRLASLGIRTGQRITLAALSLFKGSVLLLVGYNRVALRRAIALKIEVEPCSD